jgi:hypothetical protein
MPFLNDWMLFTTGSAWNSFHASIYTIYIFCTCMIHVRHAGARRGKDRVHTCCAEQCTCTVHTKTHTQFLYTYTHAFINICNTRTQVRAGAKTPFIGVVQTTAHVPAATEEHVPATHEETNDDDVAGSSRASNRNRSDLKGEKTHDTDGALASSSHNETTSARKRGRTQDDFQADDVNHPGAQTSKSRCGKTPTSVPNDDDLHTSHAHETTENNVTDNVGNSRSQGCKDAEESGDDVTALESPKKRKKNISKKHK